MRSWSSCATRAIGSVAVRLRLRAVSRGQSSFGRPFTSRNLRILETSVSPPISYAGMGTTIVAARVVDGRLSSLMSATAGCIVMRGRRLRQVTRDDSWVAADAREQDPQADPWLLQQHPLRNALTNVVGARSRTDVHVVGGAAGRRRAAAADDRRRPRRHRRRPARAVDAGRRRPRAAIADVVAAALARGSRDNCTAIVARYDD